MSRTFRFLYWRLCCAMCTTRKKVINVFSLSHWSQQWRVNKEIESLTKDDDTEEPNRDNPDVTSNEQAKDVDSDDVEESEDESDHEESTEDNERVIVKKEMTSDNEDEAAEPSDANIRDSTPTKRTSNEKLLTEAESEEADDDVGNVDGDGDRNGDREEEGDRELDELLRTTLEPFVTELVIWWQQSLENVLSIFIIRTDFCEVKLRRHAIPFQSMNKAWAPSSLTLPARWRSS